jgi:penicillin-binding protein 1A
MSKTVKIFWKIFFIAWAALIVFIFAINFGLFGKLPSLVELENPSMLSSSEIYAADGSLMGKYYLKDRTNAKYSDISINVINALIATEDERFYQHSGIDVKGTARAVIFLGTKGGASTITQQLAKNMLFEQGSKNFVRRIIEKTKEWIISVKLERNFTKEEILSLYLNTVSFSDNLFGIGNASRTFFQKEPDRLSVEEAAVLVGMVNGPTIFNPRRNPKAALDRRNLVINRMASNGYIPEKEAEVLKLKPIQLKFKKLDENAGIAPYFREVLRDEVKKWCRENKNPKTGNPYDIYKDGLKIFTTINPQMQEYAEIAVYRHMQNLQKVFSSQKNIKDGSIWKTKDGKAILQAAMKQSERWKNGKEDEMTEDEIKKSFDEKVPMKIFAWNDKREKDTVMTPLDSIKYHKQIMQVGFLSIDPQNGGVKAWVGGSNFKTFKFDHVNINTKRQVGSTFKPILYTVGVMNGYTPETVFPSGPINMGNKVITGTGGPMAICLAYSKNPGAVFLINQLGVQRTIDFAQECGIKSKIPPYPSIALGSADISLIEMVQAYTMFPGRGFNVKPYFIDRIEDRNGNVLATFHAESKEVISEADAYVMTKMMQGVVDFGTGRAIRSAFGVNGELAGKTGTTNDNADGWFIGFSPQLLSGVWVGCDDPFLRLLNTTGGAQMAMPAWAYYYQQVFNDKKLNVDPLSKFVVPETLNNEAIYDYQALTQGEQPPPAEGEDIGSGSSSEYIEVPISDRSEKVVSESKKLDDDEKKILEEAKKQAANKAAADEALKNKSNTDTTAKKKKGLFKKIFGKKE